MSSRVTFSSIARNKYNMAPSQLAALSMANTNSVPLAKLLSRKLSPKDNGIEVGSINYISKSPKYFIRTKALQEDYFTPFLSIETVVPVRPQAFFNSQLSEGDIIISKDSNIGECVILDKDYPDHMLSGALYKLPITKNKYYVFAFIKHQHFRDQLDLLVPRGATIRHAGTKFLECEIPFPKQKNANELVEYIESLVRLVVMKEMEIKRKNQTIFTLIDDELAQNQGKQTYTYAMPVFQQLKKLGRLDTGLYVEEFQKSNFLVKNYKYGSIDLLSRGYKLARGTSLEIKGIGTRIDSETYKEGFYELIIPANISEYGTVVKSTFIGTPAKLKTIKKGDIIFGGEGFKKGRSFVVCEDTKNIATNYHGIRIYSDKPDITDSIFLRCFLAYSREKGIIDYIGVGGSGGHCAPQYFHLINTPLFPEKVKQEIASVYYRQKEYPSVKNVKELVMADAKWNKEAGIIQIDQSIKKTRRILDGLLQGIINDERVSLQEWKFV